MKKSFFLHPICIVFAFALASCGPKPEPSKDHEAAVALLKQPGDPSKLSEAVVLLQKNVQLGYAPSESTLAVLYATGKGVPKDDAKSLELLRKAAGQGFDKAQYNLGSTLLKKTPVPLEEAISWLEKAANQGFLPSKKQLADLYYFGDKGVAVDRGKARQWALLAANQGDHDSENMMGSLLRFSENPKEANEAAAWYEKAAKAGLSKAQANLGMLLFSRPDADSAAKTEGLAWVIIASTTNEPLATNMLRDLHVPPEMEDAARKRAKEISESLTPQPAAPKAR